MKATITKHLHDNQSVLVTEAGQEIVINLEDSDNFHFAYEDDPDCISNYVNGHTTSIPLIVGDEVVVEPVGHGEYTVAFVNLKDGDRRKLRPGM